MLMAFGRLFKYHRTNSRRSPRGSRLGFESLEVRWVPAGCTVSSDTCFAIIGDYGDAGGAERDVADLVKGWKPDFIVTSGDNNYPDGKAATIDANIGQYYHDYIFPYTGNYGAGASSNKFFPVLGNHDWHTTNAQPYRDYFKLPGNERYYTVRQGSVEFFMIDSDDHEPDGNVSSSVQAQWLKNQLASSTAPWKLVVFHHPPYSSGKTHGSEASMRWPFEQWGASAVIAGHEHNYERLVQGDFPYFVNGAGGESLYGFATPIAGSKVRYSTDFGAMLVDATSSLITFQFINRSGSIIDTYGMGQVSSLPTVTIEATDSTAAEPSNSGLFTVQRTGSTSSSLSVKYVVSGTAINGTDYQSLAGTINIPAGSSSATVRVIPKDDTLSEKTETITLTLSPSSAYRLGSGFSATAQLKDNDQGGFTPMLVARGVSWRYLDDGSDQGKAWRGLSYNDSGWSFGSAELGYGDGDEATLVSFGKNPDKKYITTYFRRSFDVSDASLYGALNLRLLRDDGAIVYLNGTEVFRSNMPTGFFDYKTKASSGVSGADETKFFQATINKSLLRTGTNVLAVEVHLKKPTDTDLSFDLELTGSSA